MSSMFKLASAMLLLMFSVSVFAAGGVVKTPTGVAPDRYVYYPGTEELAKDEIRVIACGTGLPAARRGQAATCFLIETGNGDKFLFDIGSGSMANIAALMIPYQYLDKVFLSHLHTDHMGDILGLWAGGWTSGRPNALQVWGPSGATKEMGTAYAMEHFLKFVNWDKVTRDYKINPIPGQVETHEFDYKGVDQVVYQEDGVTIRSYPAIHAGDGPVSYKLEYAGMSVFFSGDTVPNKWYVKYGKGVDLAIHESFQAPDQLVKYYNQPPQLAWRACCEFHTSPQSFGKIMSTIKPSPNSGVIWSAPVPMPSLTFPTPPDILYELGTAAITYSITPLNGSRVKARFITTFLLCPSSISY